MWLSFVAGGAEFTVGEAVPQLDAVILCTGYNYTFPFLDLQARAAWLDGQNAHTSSACKHSKQCVCQCVRSA